MISRNCFQNNASGATPRPRALFRRAVPAAAVARGAVVRTGLVVSYQWCRGQKSSLRPNCKIRADSPVWMIACVVGGATVAQHDWANTDDVMDGEPVDASRGLSKLG